VKLSYFYLLDNTADWDTVIAATWVLGAVLWQSCSLIYLAVFVYETIEEKKELVSKVGA
jgi:hypothetical protein